MAFSHRSSKGPIQKIKKRNSFLGPKCNIQKSYKTPPPKKKKKFIVWKSNCDFLPLKAEPNGHLVIMVGHNINLVHWSSAPSRYGRHLSLMAKFGALARSAFHSATWQWRVCVFKWVSSVAFVFWVVLLFPEIKLIVFEKDEMTQKKKKKRCVYV